jgi:4-hydroxymandelate oxidase
MTAPDRASSVRQLIDKFEAQAELRLDEAVYEFFRQGAGDETALDEASGAWRSFRLLPHVLRDVSSIDMSVDLLGTQLPSPIGIAPVAYQGLLDVEAEVATVRSAGKHLSIVPTRSTRLLEEIAAAGSGPWWFQVYVTADRDLSDALVARACAAGATALVLTGDTPYVGRKVVDRPNKLGTPSTMINLAQHLKPGSDAARATEQNPGVTVAEIKRLADLSGLPVLVKGVMRADDAQRCLEAGAAGLIVSNHGGRQLDHAAPTAVALPAVVAVAGTAPVLVDGGIRSGIDVLVALALGARTVLLGRPVAWALAADGASGVQELLARFDDEFEHVLALSGRRSLAEVTEDLVAH